GWIPFSVGDILYILAIILAVRAIIHLIVKRKNKGAALAKGCRPALSKLFYGALLIYVCFNICWGLNYNRVTVTEQFELEQEIYEVPDLEKLVLLLKDSLNANEGRGRAGKPLSGSWEFTGPDGKQGEAMGRNKQTFRE